MTYYKCFFVLLFISVATCTQDLRNNEPTNYTEHTNRNRTVEVPSEVSKDKVQLKLYYETLCPASVDFFVSQLKPAVIRLGSHLDVHLIPYGHAKTYRSRGQYSFSCQHGQPECYGNMVHACAVDVLKNNTHALYFNSCLMQYTKYHANYSYFVSVLTWCGYAKKVRLYDVWKCVNSERGPILLKGYGEETHQLQPSYVPYLLLDGSTEYQDEAQANLLATVCRMLKPKPLVCF